MLDIIIYAALLCPFAVIGYIIGNEIRTRGMQKDISELWRLLEEPDESEE